MYTRMAMLLLACICGAASSAFAQNIESDSILLPVFDEQDATFGTRITSRNEWLAIGADHEINGARGEGDVYIYRKAGIQWALHQVLEAPDASAKNHFGLTVVLGDERMLIGAPLDDQAGQNAGALYVYELVEGDWVLEEKLLPTANNQAAFFGLSCSFGIDETEVIVGAYFESLAELNSGAAYVFRKYQGEWSLIQKLLAPGTPFSAFFGRSIAYSYDTLLISSSGYRSSSTTPSTGAVMTYQRDPEEWVWTQKDLVLPPQDQDYQGFGEWIDTRGNLAAISSPNFDSEFGEGVVNLFRILPEGELAHRQRIDPPLASCEGFGFPTTFSQATGQLMVGATRTTIDLYRQGTAFVFQPRFGIWGLPVQLIPSNSEAQDFFGLSGAFIDDDDELLIGAPRSNLHAPNAGAVFRFDLADCTQSGILDAWEIAVEVESDANGDQIPDSCQGSDCLGDLNGDGDVNGSDIGYMLSVFGSTDPPPSADLNGDGFIDGADLGLLFSAWGPCS